MATFITKLDATGSGPRVAVKDLIDVEDVPTTAGCKAIADVAQPATKDAPCLAGIRAADARIVGKANLHELAMFPIGSNPWFGTPTNPVDGARMPGGSSSGSAVAVANDDADVALGSDTGGSVRLPSACCGTAGLKTTHGRISTEAVYPLAVSLDTIGPMARDIAGVLLGMQLLEPGFTEATDSAQVIGRVRTNGDPAIEAAIDAALSTAEFEVVDIDWSLFAPALDAFTPIYFAEMMAADASLVAENAATVGDDIKAMVALADMFVPGIDAARAALAQWRTEFNALFGRVELLALPTMPILPPRLEDITPDNLFAQIIDITANVTFVNAAGAPATAQPVPLPNSHIPASLQLVGPLNSEDLLLTTAARVEAALA